MDKNIRWFYLANINLFKVSNRNTRKSCKIYLTSFLCLFCWLCCYCWLWTSRFLLGVMNYLWLVIYWEVFVCWPTSVFLSKYVVTVVFLFWSVLWWVILQKLVITPVHDAEVHVSYHSAIADIPRGNYVILQYGSY